MRGTYKQNWTVTRKGLPLWVEQGRLQGGSGLLTTDVGLAGYPVVATLLAIGNAPSAALVAACRAVAFDENVRVAITALPQVLCARFLGRHAEQAKMWLEMIWRELRPHYFGRTVHRPRIWST